MAIHYEAWLHAIRRASGREIAWTWEDFCSMGGMSIADTVTVLNQRHGLALTVEQAEDGTDDYLRDHLAEAPPCEDALTLAREGAQAGIKLAVASGGHRWRVESTLRGIGVEDLFKVVVTGEDVQHAKPAPDLFLLAAQRLAVPPARCLVIEDSPKGLEAAQAARMPCLFVESC
jgi:beta-phosphoglucomutase-like phosphatase (HAD superfamily)